MGLSAICRTFDEDGGGESMKRWWYGVFEARFRMDRDCRGIDVGAEVKI